MLMEEILPKASISWTSITNEVSFGKVKTGIKGSTIMIFLFMYIVFHASVDKKRNYERWKREILNRSKAKDGVEYQWRACIARCFLFQKVDRIEHHHSHLSQNSLAFKFLGTLLIIVIKIHIMKKL